MAAFEYEDTDLPLVVVVAATRWDEPPRMRHQITRQLLRWYNVLFVEFHPTATLSKYTGDALRVVSPRLLVFSPVLPHPVSPRIYANNPYVHGSVNARYSRKIADCAKSLNCMSILLMNFAYDFHELMLEKCFMWKCYVCVDEFPKMWRSATRPFWLKYAFQSRMFQHYENLTAKRADLCLDTHTPLVEKLKRINHATRMLTHGHEFDMKKNPSYQKRTDGKIVVSFMGYITYRLLMPWLTEVLNNQAIELRLIGPSSKFQEEILSGYKNYKHIQPMQGNALREEMAAADVLIMPYDPEMPENHVQTVSNKFFQYLAAGRPVVISDMPYYASMPQGVVYRARNATEFVEKIVLAHNENCEEYVQLRLAIAKENTWEKRGDELRQMITAGVGALGAA